MNKTKPIEVLVFINLKITIKGHFMKYLVKFFFYSFFMTILFLKHTTLHLSFTLLFSLRKWLLDNVIAVVFKDLLLD